ncbi:MAG: MFS transporter [Candidatus Bathyarchaeota archaeon]|nr:MFS transporter [Candidatus Bathyarchaeota archaeon]
MKSGFSFMKGNILVLTVCRTIWSVSQSIAWPYFSLFVLALGGSATEIGLVTAIGGLAGLILYPVGGYVADRRGRVRLVGLSTFLYAFSILFYAVAWRWEVLALGQFIQGLVTFYVPAMNAIMADSLPPGQRGIGFATTMAIPGAVGIVMPYVGGYLIDNVYSGELPPAMRLSYSISFVLGLVVAIVRTKLLKETLSSDKSDISMGNLPTLFKESYLSIWETLKWLPRTLRSVAAIEIITTFLVSIAAQFWVVYANQVIGLTAYDWGTLMLLVGAFRITISIPMGHLIDRYGPRKMILATSPIAPIATGLFIFCESFTHLLCIFLLLAIFNTVTWPAYSTLMANHIPTERRGRVLSILGQGVAVTWGGVPMGALLLFVPATVGSLIGGFIYGFNPKYPWYILTAGLIVCVLLTAKFIEEPKTPQ